MTQRKTMKKKSKVFLLILSLMLIAASVLLLKTEFPDLTFPSAGRFVGKVTESSNGSRYKTYYHNLSRTEKQAYNTILDEIYEMPDRILIPNLNEPQLDEVFKALLNDNPDLIFLGRKCKLTPELWNDYISFDYIMTKEEYAKKKQELEEKRDVIIASLSDPSDLWQTELEIHDYIIGHCSYMLEDENFECSSAYGCLITGKAACEGYSKAAKYIFDKVGIESALVSGRAAGNSEEPGDHMWNIVLMDGEYYHLDCTWDDPVSREAQPLRLHTYFNVTDEVIGVNHCDFSYDPGCNSTQANYFVRQKLIIDSYSSAKESAVCEMLVREYAVGNKGVQINFDNKESYQQAWSELIKNGRIHKSLAASSLPGARSLAGQIKAYYGDDDFYTLTFIFS